MIIAQLSDPHIVADEANERAQQRAAHLKRAVAHLMQLPAQPNVVVVTGDCVDDGSEASYELFQQILRPLAMPVYVIPGNHDNREHMQALFGAQGAAPLPGFVQYVVDDWPVRLIALDTTIPGQGGGLLCAERLGWLEQRLAEAPDRPTFISMHHPPFPTGLKAFDEIGLMGAEEFGAIVARYPNVELIVAGHVHSTVQRRFYGTVAMTCPSTAHQMLPDYRHPERLSVVLEPPACLVHVWSRQTGLLTYHSQIGNTAPVTELHDGTRWLI